MLVARRLPPKLVVASLLRRRAAMSMSVSPRIGEKRDLSPSLQPAFEKKARSRSPDIPLVEIIDPSSSTQQKVVQRQKLGKLAKKKLRKLTNIEPCSHDDVYWHEVCALLGAEYIEKVTEADGLFDSPFAFKEEVELQISRISSNGEGLAVATSPRKPWVVIVPFALPGETIKARVYRNARLHSFADFLEVVEPNTSLRDMSRVQCRYFQKCGGCQYQMLSYEKQLELKRDVVVRAYKNFSNLQDSSVPPILPTAPSPLQYGYRTKITPHFDAPVKMPRRQKQKKVDKVEREAFPEGKTIPIGFNKVGTKEVLDIEECPIATQILNETLGPMRKNILEKLHTYKKGVSLLLRESLPVMDPTSESSATNGADSQSESERICVTDHRGIVREKVGDKLFQYNASSFFQNNNSVLPSLVDYVREAIFPPSSAITPETQEGSISDAPTHLVDAYCGAGLFSIMLSPHFSEIAGIELSSESIAAATRNAHELNGLSPEHISFRAGDASAIFAAVPDFPPAKTALIIDPPRKGCDVNFLEQVLKFRCTRVVYVSCNVHTQARDIGILVKKSQEEVERGEREGKYVLESVRGFDLFPQTAHVESVAVLRLF